MRCRPHRRDVQCEWVIRSRRAKQVAIRLMHVCVATRRIFHWQFKVGHITWVCVGISCGDAVPVWYVPDAAGAGGCWCVYLFYNYRVRRG